MKKLLFVAPSLLAMLITPHLIKNEFHEAKAADGPILGTLLSKQDIDLSDSTESEIRNYYSSLNSLGDSEKQGTNILKNLKPILQNFTYYSYDNCWKIYEITDREWSLSPASETTYGTYDEANNKLLDYQYGTSASNGRNNPYLHDLYKNRDENGVTLEAGRLKAWEQHGKVAGGTDREHVWCQSRGFKASSGAEGPAGTDVHHLMAGDSRTNQSLHNNNPYGNVDTTKTYTDGTKYLPYIAGNMLGTAKKTSSQDQSDVVFEPQDCDKGDIARAIFYMAACYNNLNGTDAITQFNPNLTIVDYATSNGESEESTASHPVAMGILSDLLEWNELDPVDEYEIHRNNLIYKNYQHNRNPFIDFPQWANYIWGDKVGQTINPASDAINDLGLVTSLEEKFVKVGGTFNISATTADSSAITWSVSDESILSLSASTSNSKQAITATALKEGNATITAKAIIEGAEMTRECSVGVFDPSSDKVLMVKIGDDSQQLIDTFKIKGTTIDGSSISWSTSDSNIISFEKNTSKSGESINVTILKKGTVTITAKANIDDTNLVVETIVDVDITAKQIPWLYIIIGAIVIIVLIILVITIPSVRKKVTKSAKKSAQKAVRKQVKKSSSRKK